MTPEISFIIVNYKTPILTINCIKSIFSLIKNYSYEIIIVDNASNDNSLKALKDNFGKEIIIIESKENLGFGRANNLGVLQARGDFIFLINSDTIFIKNPLKDFIDFYKSKPQVGVLGTYLVDGNGNFTQSGGNFYSINKYLKMALKGFFRQKNIPEIKDIQQVQHVDYIIGADMFMRRSLFIEIGGFDPNIFMYFEDVELCKRISKKGLSNYLIPGKSIVHFVKSSSTSQFSRIYNTASLMYCLKKDNCLMKFRFFQALYFLLKLPLLLRISNFCNEWQYIKSIYKYKKYLVR